MHSCELGRDVKGFLFRGSGSKELKSLCSIVLKINLTKAKNLCCISNELDFLVGKPSHASLFIKKGNLRCPRQGMG